MSQTFQEIINTALKTPEDADYGIKEEAHTLPIGEMGLPWAMQLVEEQRKRWVPIERIGTADQHIIMGFGGLATFDLVAVSDPPPAGVLLCDDNSSQAIFWETFLQSIKESESPQILRARFAALANERTDIQFFTPNHVIEEMAALQKYPSSESKFEWMYNEEKYGKIRKMVLDGKIAHITLDALDSDRYKILKKTLDDNGLFVSTLYLSNIHRFLVDEDAETRGDFHKRKLTKSKEKTSREFWGNQLLLCDDNTLILNAEPNEHYDQDIIESYTPQECRQKFLRASASIC